MPNKSKSRVEIQREITTGVFKNGRWLFDSVSERQCPFCGQYVDHVQFRKLDGETGNAWQDHDCDPIDGWEVDIGDLF